MQRDSRCVGQQLLHSRTSSVKTGLCYRRTNQRMLFASSLCGNKQRACRPDYTLRRLQTDQSAHRAKEGRLVQTRLHTAQGNKDLCRLHTGKQIGREALLRGLVARSRG